MALHTCTPGRFFTWDSPILTLHTGTSHTWGRPYLTLHTWDAPNSTSHTCTLVPLGQAQYEEHILET